MAFPHLFGTLLLAAMLTPTTGVHAAPIYTKTSLGNLGGWASNVRAINNLGQAVGYASDAHGREHLFISSGGVMAPVMEGRSENIDINDAGTIITNSRIISANGTINSLPDHFVGFGINNRGQIAGEYHRDGYKGGVYTPGQGIERFSAFPRFVSGYDINDSGIVVGAVHGVSNSDPLDMPMFRPMRYYGGEIRMLEALGNGDGEAVSINNSGFVVGTTGGHAVMWAPDGKLIDLGALLGPDTFSWGLGINNHGEVVGAFRGPGDYDNRGFLFSDGAMYELSNLTGLNPDYNLIGSAFDINDNHQIVAEIYDSRDGAPHGVLLTLSDPVAQVPEPATHALLLSGLLLLASAGRREQTGALSSKKKS